MILLVLLLSLKTVNIAKLTKKNSDISKMTGDNEILAHVHKDVVSISEHIRNVDLLKPLEGERIFEYELSEKATKSKLIKGAKREPVLLEENSTSSNIRFSVGAWINVVLLSVRYWSEVKGDQTCIVGGHVIKICGTKQGKEANGKSVDSQIIFLFDGKKLVYHFYNTTQNILVNGHQYRKFIDFFLLPFFSSRVNSCLKEIKSHNEMILDKLGHKSVKRSTVKYKSGTPFVCNLCDYAAKNISSLNKHKKNEHTLSFNGSLSLMLREQRQSTRNNSLLENLMLEDLSDSELPNECSPLSENTLVKTVMLKQQTKQVWTIM